MSENDLLTAVLDLCALMHLHTAHFRPARTDAGWRTPVAGDGKGFPDLVIVGPRGVLYRELKTVRARLTAAQQVWLARLRAAGQDAEVWRPYDLQGGNIHLQLKAVA